ncbi:MAG: diaminopimelate epimerase [Pseudomonadota bacterium]
MKKIPFFKMSGSGNDFIIIDNRNSILEETTLPAFIAGVCRRRLSAGADGLILVERGEGVDFKWRFFNSDGGRAEMCGNGARCVSRFAFLKGIAGPEMSFETDIGVISAQVSGNRVKVTMPDTRDLQIDYPIDTAGGRITVSSVNTGVPHLVWAVVDLDGIDVKGLGREIRYHKHFSPAGTNVNFISVKSDKTILLRTYERGVEDETLACGTGAIASAVVMAAKTHLSSPIRVKPRGGGYLTIHFRMADGQFTGIRLEGDARVIYEGELWEDAWNEGGMKAL